MNVVFVALNQPTKPATRFFMQNHESIRSTSVDNPDVFVLLSNNFKREGVMHLEFYLV